MTWAWFALSPAPVPGAYAGAEVTDVAGATAGFLQAWDAGDEQQPEGAVKIDARAVDPDGPAGWMSLAVALRPSEQWIPFDDPSVTHALRAVLAGPAVDVVSTLLLGNARFVGGLRGVHGEGFGPLAEDPFERIYARRLLRVGSGFLGETPAPVGPGTQRWGSDQPWPAEGFEVPAPT